jgi:transcriptional regulator with XRE-family HTH domain
MPNRVRGGPPEPQWAVTWRENITLLRDLWKDTGRRPEELAFRLEVSKPTLQNWAHEGTGSVQGPGLAHYAKVREWLGLDFLEPQSEDEIWEAMLRTVGKWEPFQQRLGHAS